jgi:hypothetical protein
MKRTREPDEFAPIWPVPDDAPKPAFGNASARWVYRDRDGNVLFHVARYDRADGSKQLIPYTWGRLNGNDPEWRQKSFPSPRPLFGLDHLADRPSDPVLVVEGEKVAVAARKLVPGYVVVTWPTGAKSVKKADWTPLAGRDVVVWPDNDEPGLQAADDIVVALEGIASRVRIVNLPGDLPEGWDLADAAPNGLDIGAFDRGRARDRNRALSIYPRSYAFTPSHPSRIGQKS